MSKFRNIFWASRKRKLATVASSLALIAAGSALAAWLISATGSTGGKIGTLAAPTVTAAPASGSALLPGGTGDATASVQNPNNTPLKVTGVQDAGGAATFPQFSSCTGPTANVTVPTKTFATPVNVPANTTTVITLPDSLKLDADAPNGCQGESFTKSMRLDFATG